MENSEIKCPYCGKMNSINSEKCSCGYYFNESKYRDYSNSSSKKLISSNVGFEYPFLKILIVIFYIFGIIELIAGVIIFISAFINRTSDGENIWILGLALIITSFFQLGYAELIKILIRIEINTRDRQF